MAGCPYIVRSLLFGVYKQAPDLARLLGIQGVRVCVSRHPWKGDVGATRYVSIGESGASYLTKGFRGLALNDLGLPTAKTRKQGPL